MALTFLITRGYQDGKPLTPQQRTSSLFAEEPVVLGRTLRRGSPPMEITKEVFERNKGLLLMMEKAGAICIHPMAPQEAETNPEVANQVLNELAPMLEDKEVAEALGQPKIEGEKDLVDEVVEERTEKNESFPAMVEEATTGKRRKKKE